MSLLSELLFVTFHAYISVENNICNLLKFNKLVDEIIWASQNYADLLFTWTLIKYLQDEDPFVHMLYHFFLHANSIMPRRTKFLMGIVAFSEQGHNVHWILL